jgi:hypothetical protein
VKEVATSPLHRLCPVQICAPWPGLKASTGLNPAVGLGSFLLAKPQTISQAANLKGPDGKAEPFHYAFLIGCDADPGPGNTRITLDRCQHVLLFFAGGRGTGHPAFAISLAYVPCQSARVLPLQPPLPISLRSLHSSLAHDGLCSVEC